MTDPESTELLKAAAEGSAEGTTRAVLQALAPFATEAAGTLGDLVRFVRWRLQLRILAKAKALLDEQGIDTQAVPLKILVPLLELSSLEDEADDEMVTRWAALLANAAGGGQDVLPSFPAILAELSSNEARILDALYRQDENPYFDTDAIGALQADLDVQDAEIFAAYFFNLSRLSLIDVQQGSGWPGPGTITPSFVVHTMCAVQRSVSPSCARARLRLARRLARSGRKLRG